MLEGAARIEIDGGPTLELAPGDIATLPKGAVTRWHLTLPFKELWVLRAGRRAPRVASGGHRLRLWLDRDGLALDVALAHEPQGEHGAGEARRARRACSTSLRPARKPSRAACASAGARPGAPPRARWSRLPDDAASTSSARPSPLAGARRSASATLSAPRPTKIAPQTAIPTATPTWRNVSLMPAAIPLSLLRHDAHRDVGDHRVEQPDGDARDDEAGEQRRPLRAGVDAAHQQQPDADAGEPRRSISAGRDAREQRAGDRRRRRSSRP